MTCDNKTIKKQLVFDFGAFCAENDFGDLIILYPFKHFAAMDPYK